MVSDERVVWLAEKSGIRIDAFGGPVVDKFSMLTDLCRRVEKETEDRLRSLGFAEPVVVVKRGRGRPKKT